jgi:hypothetical protein
MTPHTLSTLPDEHTVYVPGVGEVTLGEVRASSPEEIPALATDDDTTVRMWVLIALYDPKASPWRSGRIRVGSKEYPASVCTSDRFLPLYTSSGMFADADINAPSRQEWRDIPSPTRGSP